MSETTSGAPFSGERRRRPVVTIEGKAGPAPDEPAAAAAPAEEPPSAAAEIAQSPPADGPPEPATTEIAAESPSGAEPATPTATVPSIAQTEPVAGEPETIGADASPPPAEPTPVPPAPEPVRPAPPEPAAPPRRQRLFVPLLVAGLAGGAVGVGATMVPGLLPGGDPAGPRVAAIESRVAGLEPKLGPLETRLGALEGAVKAAAPRSQVDDMLARLDPLAATSGRAEKDIEGLGGRLSALEAALRNAAARPAAAAVPPAAASSGDPAALQALTDRIAALENRPPPAAPAPPAPAVPPEITERLAALENRPPPAVPPPAVPPEFAERLAKAETLAAALGVKLDAVEPRIGANAADAAAKLGAIEQRVARLDAALAGAAASLASAKAVRVHALTSALILAFGRGEPYRAELDALAALGVPADKLAALGPFADKGAPSVRAIENQFEALAGPIAATDLGATKAEGLGDRLAQGLSTLVRVRPSTDTGGVDAAAGVTRIEAALTRGALAEALRQWQTLPAPAREQSRAWGEVLEKRVAADAAARAVAADALRTIAGAGG